jgi:hypothetical protein
MHNYSNLELMIEKVLFHAQMKLEPFKNDNHNRSVLIERDILQWILNQNKKFSIITFSITYTNDIMQFVIAQSDESLKKM